MDEFPFAGGPQFGLDDGVPGDAVRALSFQNGGLLPTKQNNTISSARLSSGTKA